MTSGAWGGARFPDLRRSSEVFSRRRHFPEVFLGPGVFFEGCASSRTVWDAWIAPSFRWRPEF
eukprot:1643806-Pyramimonas_sp.AAC.1